MKRLLQILIKHRDLYITVVHRVQKIVEDLLASLGREQLNPHTGNTSRPTLPSRGCHYLHVRFGRGSAFLDQPFLDSHEKEKGTIVLSVLLFGQRFTSKPASASVEPDIDDAFLFEIPQNIDRSTLYKVVYHLSRKFSCALRICTGERNS